MSTSASFLSEAVALAYGWVPRPVRRALLPATIPAFALARRLPAILSQLRVPVLRVEGREKSGGRPLSLLAAVDGPALPFLLDLVFSEVGSRAALGRAALARFPELASGNAGGADLAVVHGDEALVRPLAKEGFFLIPDWVDLTFDLGPPLGESWGLPSNKTVREHLRRIRKYRYSFEITSDPAQFREFYDRMYLPFIPAKFGPAAEVVGRRKMRRFFESGVLLLVRRDGRAVAGNIIVLQGGTARSMIAGLSRGDPVLLRQSALAASYYFTLVWAKDRGLRVVDFGGCRPLLNDGLLYFKKRWGMKVGPSGASRNAYGLRPLALTPAVRDFLAGHPFIFRERRGLAGVALSGAARPLSAAAVESAVRAAFVPGLERLDLVSPAGFSGEARREAAAGRWPRVVFEPGPPEAYFRVPLRPGKGDTGSRKGECGREGPALRSAAPR